MPKVGHGEMFKTFFNGVNKLELRLLLLSLVIPLHLCQRLFERGLAYVGTDWLSHPLWDMYIAFEKEHGTPANVVDLYTRVIQVPLRELKKYWVEFKNYTTNKAELLPKERTIVSPKAFLDILETQAEERMTHSRQVVLQV